MVRQVSDLIAVGVNSIELSILVFGPQVADLSANARTRDLQNKRIQIKAELEAAGHNVKYAEELVDLSLTGPAANPLFQEVLIMQEYDLIVNIVDSPGSIVEATVVALKPSLARKTALFLDASYVDGLVGQACLNAQDIGAHYQTYAYPDDLVHCNLLGYVFEQIKRRQKEIFLS